VTIRLDEHLRSLKTISVKPGDVIVAEVDVNGLRPEQLLDLVKQLQNAFPFNKVVAHDVGVTLKVQSV
jgi:hypothetical protein